MLHAQSSDKLLVHGLVAVLSQDTQKCLPFVQGLGGLPHTTGQAISNKSLLQNLLNGSVNIHWARWSGGRRNIISLNIRHGEFLDEFWVSCRSE